MAVDIDALEHLLQGNKEYIASTDPSEFTLLSQGQTPQILWIGCADSRIPETTICQCKPGDIFVHRNIANTVHADDNNAASVVEYAVTYLKVKKIVVCGHTFCGGAAAALGDGDLGGTLNKWLGPVRELRRRHGLELAELSSDDARSARLAELNVQRSLGVIESFPTVKSAVRESNLTLHGLIYDIGIGQLRSVNLTESVETACAFDDLE